MNKAMTVLVVEDDKPIRNLISTTLKTHEYKFLTAKDGNDAIMQASSHNPDVVLLDLGLPDIDGIEVIKKIRSWSNMIVLQRASPKPRLLLLSAILFAPV